MKTNFIIPSWSYWKEPTRAQPLTQLYLATLLKEQGVDVELTDLRGGPDWENPKIIKDADAYLYTVASPDKKEVDGIIQDIKQHGQKGLHIAGGPHPTIMPADSEHFDSIVVGPGEEALKQIISDFPDVKTAYKVPKKSASEYPFPRREFLPKDKIVNDELFKTRQTKSTTAQFSFGCPYSCSFCANYGDKKTSRRSLESIGEEIDYLKSDYQINGLSLQDEVVIPANKQQAEEFFELMKSKGIYWRGQTRALCDTSILKRAKESGLVELSFGLESADQDVVDMTNKKINIVDVEKSLQACKNYDIKTRVYLLNGLPGEKKDIVAKTIAFIDKNKPDNVLLSSLQPYPGSPIEQNPEKYGIENVSTEYDQFNHLLCRFADSKDSPERAVPYSFAKGKGLLKKEIISNMLSLQSYLRGRQLNK